MSSIKHHKVTSLKYCLSFVSQQLSLVIKHYTCCLMILKWRLKMKSSKRDLSLESHEFSAQHDTWTLVNVSFWTFVHYCNDSASNTMTCCSVTALALRRVGLAIFPCFWSLPPTFKMMNCWAEIFTAKNSFFLINQGGVVLCHRKHSECRTQKEQK